MKPLARLAISTLRSCIELTTTYSQILTPLVVYGIIFTLNAHFGSIARHIQREPQVLEGMSQSHLLPAAFVKHDVHGRYLTFAIPIVFLTFSTSRKHDSWHYPSNVSTTVQNSARNNSHDSL